MQYIVGLLVCNQTVTIAAKLNGVNDDRTALHVCTKYAYANQQVYFDRDTAALHVDLAGCASPCSIC